MPTGASSPQEGTIWRWSFGPVCRRMVGFSDSIEKFFFVVGGRFASRGNLFFFMCLASAERDVVRREGVWGRRKL